MYLFTVKRNKCHSQSLIFVFPSPPTPPTTLGRYCRLFISFGRFWQNFDFVSYASPYRLEIKKKSNDDAEKDAQESRTNWKYGHSRWSAVSSIGFSKERKIRRKDDSLLSALARERLLNCVTLLCRRHDVCFVVSYVVFRFSFCLNYWDRGSTGNS